MRTLIVVIAIMLAPFAIWTAGCRQDRQAAFPSGVEVKSLARAESLESRHPTVPMIPAVDREIARYPEPASQARIQAVMDREAQLVKAHHPGLFVLNDPEPAFATVPASHMPSSPTGRPAPSSYAPAPAARPADQRQAPARPDFWSKQVEPIPGGPGLMPLPPADISAMRPAAPRNAALPLPMPQEPMFAPEPIPGLFLGGDDEIPLASKPVGRDKVVMNPSSRIPAPIWPIQDRRAVAESLTGVEPLRDWQPPVLAARQNQSGKAIATVDETASLPIRLAELLSKAEDETALALRPLPDLAGGAPLPLPEPSLFTADAGSSDWAALPIEMPSLEALRDEPLTARADNALFSFDEWRPADPVKKSAYAEAIASPALPGRNMTLGMASDGPSGMARFIASIMDEFAASLSKRPSHQGDDGVPEKLVLVPAMNHKTTRAFEAIDATVDVPPIRF